MPHPRNRDGAEDLTQSARAGVMILVSDVSTRPGAR